MRFLVLASVFVVSASGCAIPATTTVETTTCPTEETTTTPQPTTTSTSTTTSTTTTPEPTTTSTTMTTTTPEPTTTTTTTTTPEPTTTTTTPEPTTSTSTTTTPEPTTTTTAGTATRGCPDQMLSNGCGRPVDLKSCSLSVKENKARHCANITGFTRLPAGYPGYTDMAYRYECPTAASLGLPNYSRVQINFGGEIGVDIDRVNDVPHLGLSTYVSEAYVNCLECNDFGMWVVKGNYIDPKNDLVKGVSFFEVNCLYIFNSSEWNRTYSLIYEGQ